MIYICIPTHNEQQTVGVVLWKLRQVLTEYPRDYQLLVADDASTDKTLEVLEPYTRVLPLTVIRNDERRGYAASMEMLLREATRRSEYPKRDIVVTLQADFSEEPDDLVPLLRRMEAGADLAVGTKVSATKDPPLRRFARTLSGFFVRGQQWPEGIVDPFDGFRAYRLSAVKGALDESGSRRVLRYDGWAGHAELLRAVLPHARRVDVVEVGDRVDRLQRPRRERPLAAALRVRAMMRNAEPAGLVSVEELDRIAATASRTRDRTVALNGGNGGGNGRRAAAGRGRERQSGRERERPRSEGRGRTGRTASGATGAAAASGATGAAAASGATATGGDAQQPRRERPVRERPPRERQPRKRRESGQPAPAESEAVTESPEVQPSAGLPGEVPEAATQAAGGDEAAPRPKRRRRRRGRGGSGAGTAEPASGAEQSGAGEPTGAEDSAADTGAMNAGVEDDGAGGAAGEQGGERKRRRRGGRRGGRGRRRRNGSEDTANADGPGSADAPAGESAAAPTAAAGQSPPADAPPEQG